VGGPDVGGLGRAAALVEWVGYPSGAVNPNFLAQLAGAGVAAGDGCPVLFLCRSGVRSVAAANAATAAGFGPAYNIVGGFEGDLDAAAHRGGSGWRAAGLPWKQS
jgi:rhodanese-related sulfurtransferase